MSIFDEDLLAWDSLPDGQRTAYAWNDLGEPRTHNVISDANSLWEASRKARKGTAWKESVQKYWWDILRRMTALQIALDALEEGRDGAYMPQKCFQFMLNERGRIRPICGQVVDDRVVSHSLNDFVLVPAMRPGLIYDNTASLEGRGVDMALRRMACHLKRYYAREGTNKGYIRLKDQSKYYDNIRHDRMREITAELTENEMARKLVDALLKESRVDISYMTDEEYARSMEEKFDRVAYRAAGYPQRGEKWLEKGMNVGDQFSQTAGIVYPSQVDQMAKTVLGSKYYTRYMDDSTDMDRDKEALKARAEIIDREAERIGLYTNKRKTAIQRIDKGFVYLQHKYRLRADGTVDIRMKPKGVTRIKRRIRKLKGQMDAGKVTEMEVAGMVRSWIGGHRNVMTYMQVRAIEQTVLHYYGRKAYEYVYDHHEKWHGS